MSRYSQCGTAHSQPAKIVMKSWHKTFTLSPVCGMMGFHHSERQRMVQFTRTAHYPQVSLDAAVGILPLFWSAKNPADAITQHNERNPPGGPWNDFSEGWRLDLNTNALQYGDPSEEDADPAYLPLAFADLPLSQERIIVYPHAWVVILDLKAFGTEQKFFTIDRRN